MSRRIDIEITSVNGETATWRAAGAKLPKGSLNSSVVPGGPQVGQVYRAEVDQFMEGIEVLSVAPPKTASPLDPRNERIAILEKKSDGPDVTVTYAPKGRGGSRREDGDSKPRRGGSVATAYRHRQAGGNEERNRFAAVGDGRRIECAIDVGISTRTCRAGDIDWIASLDPD